jgi:hypothetical protein
MRSLDRKPLFRLRGVEITLKAGLQIPSSEIKSALRRHARGDWGEADAVSKASNERALEAGGVLESMYQAKNGLLFYVVTEADRKMTTVLLGEENGFCPYPLV